MTRPEAGPAVRHATLVLSATLALTPGVAGAQTPSAVQVTQPQTSSVLADTKQKTATAVGGVVTDSQGALVVGAEVTLSFRGEAVGTMRTNEAGQFAFAVVPGDYQVEVAAHGFAASSKSLSVSDKEATLTNMSLNPGAQVSMQVTAVPLKDYATMGTLSASFGHWYTRLGYRLRHPVAYGKYLFHSH